MTIIVVHSHHHHIFVIFFEFREGPVKNKKSYFRIRGGIFKGNFFCFKLRGVTGYSVLIVLY